MLIRRVNFFTVLQNEFHNINYRMKELVLNKTAIKRSIRFGPNLVVM